MKRISVAIVGDDRGVQRTFASVTRRMAVMSSSGERFSTGLRKMGDDTGVTRLANGFQTESGMNDRAVGDGGAAYGLGQNHEDRRQAFRAMYGHAMREGTFEEQVEFFRRDPDVGTQRANQLIARPGTSASAAAALIFRLNERPADESGEMQRQGALAESLLKQLTSSRPLAPPVAPAPPPMAAAGANGANGTATVRLEHVNPPAGLQTSVQTSGDVQYGGLRIERPQLGNAP